MATEQELVTHWIEPHPHKAGLAEVVLAEYYVPIWALIGTLRMVDGDIAEVAEGYDLPREAVEAAVAYYQQHQEVIDDRLTANAGSSVS